MLAAPTWRSPKTNWAITAVLADITIQGARYPEAGMRLIDR